MRIDEHVDDPEKKLNNLAEMADCAE